MNKYGIENFICEELLETNTAEVDEVRLILEYDTYKHGYNATLGGDGARYLDIDVDKLKHDYLKDNNTTLLKLAELNKCDRKTISSLLKINGVELRKNTIFKKIGVKKICTLTGVVIKYYDSAASAAKDIGAINGSNITKCAKGKRKIAEGYYWEYI